MNIGTAVVSVIVGVAAALAVRSTVKDRKSGKTRQCGIGCTGCGGHCVGGTCETQGNGGDF